MNETIETSKKVIVPLDIPYDILAGGACRDCMCDEIPNDYDLFYSDKGKFIDALKIVSEQPGAKCTKTMAGTWLDIKSTVIRWETEDFKFDFILCDANIQQLKEHAIDSFDYTVNSCYQEEGKQIVCQKDALPLYKSKTLELNRKQMSLSRNLTRMAHFNERGWVAGSTVIKNCFDRIELMYKDIDKFKEEEKQFIKINTEGYSFEAVAEWHKVWNVFFPLVSDEHLILGFLSDCDFVLEATRKQYEERQIKAKKNSNKGRNIFTSIGDFFVSLETIKKKTPKEVSVFDYIN